MAAPSVRTVGTAIFGTTGTLVPVVPTHSANDILLCFVGSSANASVTPTHSMPGDWTLIDSGANTAGTIRARLSVFWKKTAGGEANPTVTLTPTGAGACHHSAVIHSIQSADTGATPIEGASNNQTAGASTLALTLTTSTNDTLGWLATHHADNVATGVTDNANFTDRIATDNATGIDGFMFNGDKTIATAGAGNGGTVTYTSGGTSVGIAGIAFAVKPLASQTFERTVNDSVAATEADSTNADFGRSLSNAIAVTDNTSRSADFPRSASDSVAVTDSPTRTLYATFSATVSNSVAVTDGTTAETSGLITRTINDSSGVSDSAIRATDTSRPISNSAAATDSISRGFEYARSTSDAVGTSDSAPRSADFERSLSNSVAATDSIVRAADIARTLSNSVSATDSTTGTLPTERTIGNTVGVTDILTRAVQSQRTLNTDAVSVTDQIRAGRDMEVSINNSVSVTDAMGLYRHRAPSGSAFGQRIYVDLPAGMAMEFDHKMQMPPGMTKPMVHFVPSGHTTFAVTQLDETTSTCEAPSGNRLQGEFVYWVPHSIMGTW